MTSSQSSNSPSKPKPAEASPPPPKTSGPDRNINYGACPGCGKKPKDDLIVR